MFDKTIFHIDVNSAFLSWEAVHRLGHRGARLDLRTVPSAVGGDISMRHGIILAKSIPAKKYGVRTGESIPEALQKCPELVIVPPNYELYDKTSKAFIELLKEYTPDVEQYSVDEAFADMTGTAGLWGDPVSAAERLRNQVRQELGFTVNIGVSQNKLLAKMASDFKKPDQVHTLFREEIYDKMWPLPVEDLFFVGRGTSRKLYNMGIHTIGDLAQTSPDILRAHLKKHGEVIWNFANGRDVSVVEKDPPANKSYGNSTTIAFDVTDPGTAKMVLLALAETVASRMRKDGVKAEMAAVGIKDFEFHYTGHQRVLQSATNITQEIHRAAVQLFDELWDGRPVRHLGLWAGRIREAECSRQLILFDGTDYEKLEKMDMAVDDVRRKYGIDAIKRAAFVHTGSGPKSLNENNIDHMSGGISRERRHVDYDKVQIL